MHPPPPLSRLPRYPVVGGIALLALLVSLAAWSEQVDVSPLEENPEFRRGEVWRLVTSTLPHTDVIHLAFNLYWLWVLGSAAEEMFGHLKTLAIVLLLAVGSSAPEYALVYGGVGLSGVGYGLFGMLWVLSRRDERFRDAVDGATVGLFVGWFFLCIVLTAAGVIDVANIAHGAGAVVGAALGWAVSTPRLRGAAVTGLAVCVVAAAAALLYARPYINLTEERAWERAELGYRALLKEDPQTAVRHLEAAVRVEPTVPEVWFNLGIAYQELDRLEEAAEAYRRAAELEPGNEEYGRAWKDFEEHLQAAAPEGKAATEP